MTKTVTVFRAATVGAAWLALAAGAQAQEHTPSISGNSWIAIGLVVGLVLLVFFFISGTLSVSRRDKSEDDDAGVGILEGIDEDDEKPRKR
ncbi:MAG: hypothetical protein KBA31_09380 [Alphaproteobacteria bacterium]|nr:hypothetical protein [Alphaproteobacteria bacterium]